MTTSSQITGRYAPSPTGDLHLGNLRTAMLAWLQARLRGGKFLLRMEDLDLPRVVPGSADQILRDLEWMGLDWDGEVMYQSGRNDAYQAALEKLDSDGVLYPCFCSRKDIQNALSAPHEKSSIYPGTCCNLDIQLIRQKTRQKNPSIRIRVPQALANEVGDFVVKRADNLFAYQMAVVVDDLDQEITDVVRGADLLDSCSRQLFLASQLQPAASPIRYFHAPLMLDEAGNRLSKRDGSESITQWREQGNSAEQLIAYLFNSVCAKSLGEKISLTDLCAKLEYRDLADVWLDSSLR